jgi:type II secretory pathway component GspD/PulD (secretin)
LDHIGRYRKESEHFVITTAGTPAFIQTGREIPFHERWVYFTRRYAVGVNTVRFQKTETGFDVTPAIVGDRVTLTITPRISYQAPGRQDGAIKFGQAATEITIPMGKWIVIGGMDGTHNEVIDYILGHGRGSGGEQLAISLFVELL